MADHVKLVLDKEYEYLGQFVKLIATEGISSDGPLCTIETRFGERTQIWASELSEKPPKRKK